MTDEETRAKEVLDEAADLRRKSYIAALQEERRGYEIRGQTDRVAQVDRELHKAGYRVPKEKENTRSAPNVEHRVKQ